MVPGPGGAAVWCQAHRGGWAPRPQVDRKAAAAAMGQGDSQGKAELGVRGSTGRREGYGGRGPGAVTSPPPQPPPRPPHSPSPAAPCRCGGRTRRRTPAHPGRWAGPRAGSPPIGCGARASAALWRPLAGAAGTAAVPPGGSRSATPGRPRRTKARGGGGVWFISSPFILFPQKYLGGGGFCTESRHSAARGGGGLLRVSRSTADTHTVTMVRGRSAGIALTTVNSSWGAARPRVQPRPGTYLQRGGRRGRARQRGGAGSPARKPGARIAVGTAMNRWRRERERRKRKKEKKRRKEKESRQRTASTETR